MQFERFDLLYRVVEGQGRAKYDLSSSDMPPQRLAEYGGLMDQSLAESHVSGGEALRGELARLYGGKAEDYIVTAGASEANFAVCAALLSPGDAVLAELPVYQPLEAIPRALTGNVASLVRKEEDGFTLAVNQVAQSLPPRLRLLVLSNLHNPTGAALDRETVQGLADLAAEQGFHVLVDEIFRDLAFDHEVPTIAGRSDASIVTSSMSKFYGAGGLRIGWIRTAPPVRARIRGVLDYLSITPAGPSEAIALALLKNRSKTVSRNRRLIAEGRKIARDWAEETGHVAWHEPVAHLAFPNLGVDTVRLAERLLTKHETFIAPGEAFGLGRHFRLNIGIRADLLEEGLRRLSVALREL